MLLDVLQSVMCRLCMRLLVDRFTSHDFCICRLTAYLLQM